jgi:hypothetical protein
LELVCAILDIFSKMQVLGFGRARDQEFDEVKDPSKLGIFLHIGLFQLHYRVPKLQNRAGLVQMLDFIQSGLIEVRKQ